METDFPEVREVDLKLIELARRMSGKIVTNDFNLNKVAQLRGVAVLNINELANSLKPVVLPGEVLHVFVIKEGKERGRASPTSTTARWSWWTRPGRRWARPSTSASPASCRRRPAR